MHKKGKAILLFMHGYMQEKHRPPTIREIQAKTGISSTSVVTYHLDKLNEGEYINRESSISRGLSITDKGINVLIEMLIADS